MDKVFVDTNVFLRFFTQDDQGQHERAARLFLDAEGGQIELVTGPPVFFELAWTLRSAYKQKAGKVVDVLERILGLPGMTVTDESLVTKALEMARDGSREFADAYIAANALLSKAQAVATFNQKDFQKMGVPTYPL
jgi:predicted nucleic acid-binding protein